MKNHSLLLTTDLFPNIFHIAPSDFTFQQPSCIPRLHLKFHTSILYNRQKTVHSVFKFIVYIKQ